MFIELPAFACNHRTGENAKEALNKLLRAGRIVLNPARGFIQRFPKYPPAHSAGCLALSFLLAGISLPRRGFVPAAPLDAPAGVPNCGFQI